MERFLLSSDETGICQTWFCFPPVPTIGKGAQGNKAHLESWSGLCQVHPCHPEFDFGKSQPTSNLRSLICERKQGSGAQGGTTHRRRALLQPAGGASSKCPLCISVKSGKKPCLQKQSKSSCHLHACRGFPHLHSFTPHPTEL